MDDSVQVRCRRCKTVFRDRARRMQNGYSRQCPCCEVVLFFDEDSAEPTIKRSMKAARRIRAALREQEFLALTESRGTAEGGRHGTGGREVEDGRQD
jgi:predicted  nucleic acid-binding Zn-ribbon protein